MPGAARSTESAPKFEKPASSSYWSVAATQTTLPSCTLHGYVGTPSLLDAVVAGRHHEERAPDARRSRGERGCSAGPAERAVHHARAHVGGVVECVREVEDGAAARAVEAAHGQDLRVPREPGDAGAVVADRRDRPGDVRAVVVEVVRVVVVADEVPAAHVVDEPVAVVVPAAGRVGAVGEDVRRQVGVVPCDSAVHDGDEHVRAADGQVPRELRVDVGVRGARHAGDRLPEVPQAPEVADPWVVRYRGRRLQARVGLGIDHVRVALERADRRLRCGAGLDLDQLHAREPRAAYDAGRGRMAYRCAFGGVGTGAEADDQLAPAVHRHRLLTDLRVHRRGERRRQRQRRDDQHRAHVHATVPGRCARHKR